MKKLFSKEYLTRELKLPWCAMEDYILENTRWSGIHEIIFKDNGKYWKTTYSCGLTELQSEEPWEFENEIECEEVKLKSVIVEKWIPIN